jgi:hypothetical protein
MQWRRVVLRAARVMVAATLLSRGAGECVH